MRRWMCVWLAALAPLAACDPAAGQRRAPITNGAEGGDPAAVALVNPDGEVVCSGVLIGPRTVLSAAHCTLGPAEIASLRVFFGASLAGGGPLLDICEEGIHPDFDPATFSADLLLLRLDGDAPVEPLLLHPGVDASLVGAPLVVTGFGSTGPNADDSGTRRTGTGRVTAVTGTEIEIEPDPSQPCLIDSGGPALIDVDGLPHVAGVVSHGDAMCAQRAYFARVDVAAEFVARFAEDDCPGCAAADPAGAGVIALLVLPWVLRAARRRPGWPARRSRTAGWPTGSSGGSSC